MNLRNEYVPGNSAGDPFGMVKTCPELKGFVSPPTIGDLKRSRLESPRMDFVVCFVHGQDSTIREDTLIVLKR